MKWKSIVKRTERERWKTFLMYVLSIFSFSFIGVMVMYLLLDTLNYNVYLLWGFMPSDVLCGIILFVFIGVLALALRARSFDVAKMFAFTVLTLPLAFDTAYSVLNATLHISRNLIIVWYFPSYLYTYLSIGLLVAGLSLVFIKRWSQYVLYFIPLIFVYVSYGMSFFIPLDQIPQLLPLYLFVNIALVILVIVFSVLLRKYSPRDLVYEKLVRFKF